MTDLYHPAYNRDMEFLATIAALITLAIGWRFAAFLLGALSWVMAAFIVIGLLAGPVAGAAVPGTFIAVAVAVWFGSQVATRLRVGHWRSMVLRALLG